MNTVEFAKHIGVTQPLISKWIRQGVLKKSVKRKGRWIDINPKKGEAELKKNRDPVRGGNRTKKKTQVKTVDDEKEIAQRAGGGGIDFNVARALNEQYKAALKKIEYESKIRKLVPANEISEVWIRHIAAVKIRILGIPSKLTPIVREIIDDIEISDMIIQAIESEVEGALTELARSKI